MKRYQESEEIYQNAIEIQERLFQTQAERHGPDLEKSYNRLEDLYWSWFTQDYQKAAELHKKVVEIQEKLSNNQPDIYELKLGSSYYNIYIEDEH